jgi:hypothetical protein
VKSYPDGFGRSRFYPLVGLGMFVFFALLVAEDFGADLPPPLEVVQAVALFVMVGGLVGEYVAYSARLGPYRDRPRAGAT